MMRFFLSQVILAFGVGVIVALIRYYTTVFAWRYLKSRFGLRKRQKEAGNG